MFNEYKCELREYRRIQNTLQELYDHICRVNHESDGYYDTLLVAYALDMPEINNIVLSKDELMGVGNVLFNYVESCATIQKIKLRAIERKIEQKNMAKQLLFKFIKKPI